MLVIVGAMVVVVGMRLAAVRMFVGVGVNVRVFTLILLCSV